METMRTLDDRMTDPRRNEPERPDWIEPEIDLMDYQLLLVNSK